ncbi:MAG: amino acid ABC transporter substrate-binding protein [Rhodocyclales bacterium GT-UBC]|nr:MAG: amino acid ABC transporter substrate-binding protein [Rhodocyclales bacterium GT-UBC]
MHRVLHLLAALVLATLLAGTATGAERNLRVAVLDSSPGMAFRDANGELTGFTIGIIRALCEEMRVQCTLLVTTLDSVIEDTASGEFDIAGVSLLETPERRAKVIFAKPYFRSISLWFARPGVQPGAAGIRVSVVRGSAQDRFARSRGWETVGVLTNNELSEPLQAGLAQAAIIPMATALGMMKKEEFRRLGLVSSVMSEPELGGDAAFAISPRRPELKEQMDAALERIRRNGTYDRINSLFLPFRVN